MNEKVLKTLEYNKIIARLAEHASSEDAKKRCLTLTPGTDINEINLLQLQTKDALNRLFKGGRISFSGVHDIRDSLKRLEIGASLSITELLRVCSLLEAAKRSKAFSRTSIGHTGPDRPAAADGTDELPVDSLTGFFDQIEPLTPLCDEIRRCILSEDEIADDASSTLRSIRKSMRGMNDKIRAQMNSMINNTTTRSYLQDAVITMRDGRYCLPVKAEAKSQVPGMVHDQSSSGSTLFIEPLAVVNLNNEYKALLMKEKEEIEVILADLSSQVAEHTEEILENQKIMTFLDFTFAKAALALEQNATRPVFNREHAIHIRKGRHPLLHPKKVVPIDIYLGRDFDQLIITGPNTGGKTVSLKTVGLFTLMGQAGLHIPALDRSELSVFQDVFADIGDEQSIEQSLSTFSSHMTRIVSILKHADQDSLCLFDELCAGTDPTEGAALAIAILERLHNRKIRTMATTHYSELKVYALTTPEVENACCEFNVETLSPTYRLLIGIPGKSNAFAISRKLGLSDEIIEEAGKQLSSDDRSFEDLLADLEQSRVTIERERLEIASYKEEIGTLKKRLQEKNEKIDSARDRILREANEEARDILQNAKDVADETIRVFQKAGPGASLKDLEKSREKIRGKINEKNDKLVIKSQPKEKSGRLTADKIKKGDTVKILSMGMTGTVTSLPDHKGNVFVQCGVIRSQVNINDLVYAKEKEAEEKKPLLQRTRTGTSGIKMSKSLSVSSEINLLGKTVDEALPELDKYLDDAYLAHLPSVRVVHGKGTGALRNAVQNHLKRVKYVKSYRLGEYGEGDAGVTIVTFKD